MYHHVAVAEVEPTKFVLDEAPPHKAYKRLNSSFDEDELSSEEAEALRRRSSEYMQTYEFHISRGMYALAMFDLEQALQLYVKARLLEEGVLTLKPTA